mgnify:CR=1 FL=1
MNDTDIIVQKINEVASRTHPDSEIILFGSHARGDNSEFSDWDLLILLNENEVSFDRERQIMDDYYGLELETGEVLSPLIYSKKDWQTKYAQIPLHESIESEGLRIK